MKKAAAVALLLSVTPPAHAQRMVDLTAARLQISDGGVENVDGGVWLDDAQLAAQAKALASLRATNASLEAHAGDMPTRWVVGAFVAGVVLGGVAAGLAVTLTRRP